MESMNVSFFKKLPELELGLFDKQTYEIMMSRE